MSAGSTGSRRVSERMVPAAIVVAGILVAIAIAWIVRDRQPSPVSASEAAALLTDANLALAELENQSIDEAIPLLERVRDRLPSDPFAWRNLAVARVVALGGPEPAMASAIETARRALADLVRHEPPVPAHEWLSARIATAADDPNAAAAAYERIVTVSADDAPAWYALSRSLRSVAEPATTPPAVSDGPSAPSDTSAADAALDRACDLVPGNLWLAVEWLRAVSARLTSKATAENDLAGAIERRWTALAPFAASVKAFARTDVRELLDEAAEAVRGGDRQRAAGRLRAIANVLVPQSAADRAAIERHPLEFVLERFSTESISRLPASAVGDDPAMPVTLAPIADIAEPDDGPPVAVLLEDIDLDGSTDLVVLQDSMLRCYTRGPHARAGHSDGSEAASAETPADDDWREILSARVPAGSRGLVAADLDLDFDEARRLGEPVRSSTDPRSREDPSTSPVPDDAEIPEAVRTPADRRVRRCPAADLDLVVFGERGVTALENRGPADGLPRRLEPYAFEAIDTGTPAAVEQAAVADLDGDGRLDLVVAGTAGLRVFTGRGRDGFVPLLSEGLPPDDVVFLTIQPVDLDRDVDIDLLLGGPSGVAVLENLRHGQFRFRPIATSNAGVRGVDVVDADASWRIVSAGSGGLDFVDSPGPTGAGTADRTSPPQPAIDARPTDGLATWDYDNDGLLDLATWGEGGLLVLRGSATPHGVGTSTAGPCFARTAALAQPVTSVRSFDSADLDRDGDLDCAVATGDRVVILESRGAEAHHWLEVDLEAQQIKGADLSPSGRVNAHGLGSLLELKAGASYQARAVRRRSTHFGLGRLDRADVVRVTWMNGVPQNLIRPPADTLVCEQQILLGSCPYLYARGDRGFTFVTDLLWAAPIGLQRAEGSLMPARDHEWLKVPGGTVTVVDGRYEFEITEELWEAAYFDQVRLVAVDHPPEVSVWSNEKVGPESIASFRVHTVRESRQPTAARDGHGRDLLPALARADGEYAKPWDAKLRQGLVEPHAIEIDLGSADAPSTEDPNLTGQALPVTLFLTGWTYPTTVSLNVALSRDPSLGLPQPPSLSVPDGSGGWKCVLPFMGFPGGKTKTIAVDLAGLLPAADQRVRIEGSMEIHWDHAFFTRGEEPAAFELVDAPLVSAVLRSRGFSRIVQDSPDGPERFLHDEVTTEPKWPPMFGHFTRYGDVLELLSEPDDRLVVIGAGDAIRLVFEAPQPRPGWTRDFLFASVGWDKDANLATVEGQTVEPLPFRGMRSYPPSSEDPPPDGESYRHWLETWQTRSQSDVFHRRLRQRARGIESSSRTDGDPSAADGIGSSKPGERSP